MDQVIRGILEEVVFDFEKLEIVGDEVHLLCKELHEGETKTSFKPFSLNWYDQAAPSKKPRVPKEALLLPWYIKTKNIRVNTTNRIVCSFLPKTMNQTVSQYIHVDTKIKEVTEEILSYANDRLLQIRLINNVWTDSALLKSESPYRNGVWKVVPQCLYELGEDFWKEIYDGTGVDMVGPGRFGASPSPPQDRLEKILQEIFTHYGWSFNDCYDKVDLRRIIILDYINKSDEPNRTNLITHLSNITQVDWSHQKSRQKVNSWLEKLTDEGCIEDISPRPGRYAYKPTKDSKRLVNNYIKNYLPGIQSYCLAAKKFKSYMGST